VEAVLAGKELSEAAAEEETLKKALVLWGGL
jgi:2,3-diketo-5-methylthiopentyl-1-phosphate enolase